MFYGIWNFSELSIKMRVKWLKFFYLSTLFSWNTGQFYFIWAKRNLIFTLCWNSMVLDIFFTFYILTGEKTVQTERKRGKRDGEWHVTRVLSQMMWSLPSGEMPHFTRWKGWDPLVAGILHHLYDRTETPPNTLQAEPFANRSMRMEKQSKSSGHW